MKRELKSILVPVDFREPSVRAVKFAYRLSERFNGELLLLNVLETPGLLSDFFASGDHLVKITDQAKDRLNELAGSIRQDNSTVRISTKVERGKTYDKILEVAESVQARFIILGENHQGEGMQQDLGSTVYHVTLKSPVPVLTLKGNAEKLGDKFVVPLDLTKETSKQISNALLYGLNYGAKIYLVSALIGGIKMKDSRIYKKLKQTKMTLEENGVGCEMKLFERSEIPPFSRVIEYAEEIQAGMILVMTHQEGYTYDNYIGAFAHHIINRSKVPVLSLTSSAADLNLSQLMKGIVDPVGLLFKK
jgi:nucleotide-binding universal stress UspA family protein